ncbi:T6SS immunity protein Tli3 family protein [Escherichia albertii]|uniref:T6SS immunity protein Tli3 family protein n=1 Tax=Escherichia albertii TaxID=208962 RepID=UPI0002BC69CD|nr:hypothetical protein [Escherichia albertii]MCZ8871819.1 hypothetical protein [Escherichia albertii]
MKNSVLMISLLFFSFDIYGGNNIAPPAKYMSPNALPLQVVYRFDDHRYIILTGEKRHYDGVDYCSGQYWYTDTQKNIFSRVGDMRDHEWVNDIRGHSTQISITPSYDSPLPENITFIHDSEKYIFVPLGGDPHKKDKKGRLIYEYGEVTMSSDYGATWENINLSVEPATSDTRLTFHDGQLFIDDRDGFYLSQIPIHSFFMYYYDYHSRNNDINLPGNVPAIKNYRGWDHMQCSENAKLSVEEVERFQQDRQRSWNSWGRKGDEKNNK